MKYLAYCRKSTDEKDKQVLSIDQQLSELKEFAEKENLEIVDFLTEAQTAKVTGRPIFNSLIKRIEKGEVQGIISWNPDRLARNSVDGGKIIYLLDTGELQSLKFPTHWFENTPQGRFMLSIAFGQAKYYVDNLSQNVHRGLKYKIKTGVWPAKAPMGYRNDRNSKSIVVYEPEARPLKKAFELYSTGKYALDDIGAFLFEHGMKNKYSGGQLNDSNLRRVLMRPFYTGYMVFRGEMFKGTHTPLISKELFDKVQIVRKQRGYYHQNKSKRYDFAFTGLIKCHYCNCSITAEHRPFFFPRTNHKADYIYYHCTKKKGECLQKGYTREEILEVQFREIIKSLSVSQGWATQMNNFLVQDVETQKIEDKNKSVSLETEISQTEQKLDTLLEAYLDTVIDSESYIKKKNELMEKKQNIVSIQKQLSSDNPNWIEGVKDFIDCAQMCAKIARAENNCHDLSIMAKKVGSKYFLKDRKIEFCLNFPYNLLAANGGAASQLRNFVPTLAFGQSKYYVDNLSQNVVRGLHYKLKQGIWPTIAPYGYKNDRNTRGIILEPIISKIIKISFERFAKGETTTIKGVQDLFIKSVVLGKFGKPVSFSKIKKMLSNPFYFGLMNYGKDSVMGTHTPLVSKRNFDLVQEKLAKRDNKRPHTNNFPFTGFIKCAECGSYITAEKHFKNYPKTRGEIEYTYYRCTKKKKSCSQLYLNSTNLETQLRDIVGSLSLKELWANKLLEMLKKDEEKEVKFAKRELTKLSFSLDIIEKKLDKLLEGYLEEIVESQNYLSKKKELLQTKALIQEKIDEVRKEGTIWVEPMRVFLKEAVETAKIAHENNNCKDLAIFAKKVGSNYLLKDKRISFSPNSPHDLLASPAFDASKMTLTQYLCRGEESNLHGVLSPLVFETSLSTIPAPRLRVNYIRIGVCFYPIQR